MNCIFFFFFRKITDELERQEPVEFLNYSTTDIKRYLLLGRKAMTNLHRVLKSRDIPLPIKVYIVKVIVFSSSHMDLRLEP